MSWINLSIFDKIFVCYLTFRKIVAHSICIFKFIPVFWVLSLLKFVSPFSIFGLVWKGSYSTPSFNLDTIINF